MNMLKLSENLIRLRREKGVTQEDVADFMGVTKASVSKWEKGQSLPDILLLPQLAVYFDVTIDDLMGYEPWLSVEQIRKIYSELSADFTSLPFENVYEKCRALIKKYYSCYPFLLQMGILSFNHYMLAAPERQTAILEDIEALCCHIEQGCKDPGICNEALVIKTMLWLLLGRYEESVDTLKPFVNRHNIYSEAHRLLIQAYYMKGDVHQAELSTQVAMYSHLLDLVANSTTFLAFYMNDFEKGMTIIHRINAVISEYDLKNLNLNSVLQFDYQCLCFYCAHKRLEDAINLLDEFVSGSLSMVDQGVFLHGDDYFNLLDEWFEELDLGTNPPRDTKFVQSSALQALENPALSPLFELKEYKRQLGRLQRKKDER